MVAVRDPEVFLNNWKQIILDNLDAKIDSINAEKNDDVVLEKIIEDAYFDSMNEEVVNFDPFMHYGIANIEVSSVSAASALGITVFFEVVFADDGMGETSVFNSSNRIKLMRYERCLREIFQEKYESIRYASDAELQSIIPTGQREAETGHLMFLSGIVVTGTIWN